MVKKIITADQIRRINGGFSYIPIGGYIRFIREFLEFLRPFAIALRECNVRALHEKGKVESSIKYLRHNFFPLRTFGMLKNAQAQAIGWLNSVSNMRALFESGPKRGIAGHFRSCEASLRFYWGWHIFFNDFK